MRRLYCHPHHGARPSYVIMRAGWYGAGLRDLKSAGCDLTGGPIEHLKGGVFLCVRILLSVGISQLFGIFLSIIVFSHDIDVPIKKEWLRANATLIAAASEPVEAEIKRRSDAVTVQTAVANGLRAQVAGLAAGRTRSLRRRPAQMQQAQAELNGLLSQKTEADAAVAAAQKSSRRTSSRGLRALKATVARLGAGPRRRAALEQLANAKEHQRLASDAISPAFVSGSMICANSLSPTGRR